MLKAPNKAGQGREKEKGEERGRAQSVSQASLKRKKRLLAFSLSLLPFLQFIFLSLSLPPLFYALLPPLFSVASVGSRTEANFVFGRAGEKRWCLSSPPFPSSSFRAVPNSFADFNSGGAEESSHSLSAEVGERASEPATEDDDERRRRRII